MDLASTRLACLHQQRNPHSGADCKRQQRPIMTNHRLVLYIQIHRRIHAKCHTMFLPLPGVANATSQTPTKTLFRQTPWLQAQTKSGMSHRPPTGTNSKSIANASMMSSVKTGGIYRQRRRRRMQNKWLHHRLLQHHHRLDIGSESDDQSSRCKNHHLQQETVKCDSVLFDQLLTMKRRFASHSH